MSAGKEHTHTEGHKYDKTNFLLQILGFFASYDLFGWFWWHFVTVKSPRNFRSPPWILPIDLFALETQVQDHRAWSATWRVGDRKLRAECKFWVYSLRMIPFGWFWWHLVTVKCPRNFRPPPWILPIDLFALETQVQDDRAWSANSDYGRGLGGGGGGA